MHLYIKDIKAFNSCSLAVVICSEMRCRILGTRKDLQWSKSLGAGQIYEMHLAENQAMSLLVLLRSLDVSAGKTLIISVLRTTRHDKTE